MSSRTILLAALAASACLEREGLPASRCSSAPPTVVQFTRDHIARIDLVFVVDDSGSMREEQEALRQALPAMIEVLASGDFDRDGSLDGRDDFVPPDELGVGVVSG